jgi:adenylate cyclase
MPMSVEIERKFLVDDTGPVPLGVGTRVRQGYLAEENDVEVRVRIADEAATLTVKAGRGLARTEVELPVDLDAANALWPHTAGRRIEKTRHRVQLGVRLAEVDIYAGGLAGLCTAEVEFPSEGEAETFEPPAWFGREVTGQPAWSNASLARYGLPR